MDTPERMDREEHARAERLRRHAKSRGTSVRVSNSQKKRPGPTNQALHPGARIRGVSNPFVAGEMMMRAILAREKAIAYQKERPPRQLVMDGKWVVPVEERPKGWESWGVKEE